MQAENWKQLLNTAEIVCGSFSVLINSVLILLIVYKSPNQLGAYKYLMIYISVFEIAYSMIDIALSPIHYSHGYAFLVIVDLKTAVFGREVTSFLILIYCVFFGTSMAIFCLQFIYRYSVSIGSAIIKTLSDWRSAGWFIIPIAYSLTWAFVAHFQCGQNEETNNYTHNSILETYDLSIESNVYVGPHFCRQDSHGECHLAIDTTIGMAALSAQVGFSFFAVLYFGIKCFLRIRKLSSSRSISSKCSKLQFQVFLALITQTIIPVVLMHVPMSLLVIAAFFGVELGSASGIFSFTIALYPAIDPLPTIFIINYCRKALNNTDG